MKSFLLFLFFSGVVMIMVNDLLKVPPPQIEYRYVPRDLDTYLRETSEYMLPMKVIEDKMYWAKTNASK